MLFLSSLCKEVATFKVMFFMRNIFLLHLNLSPHVHSLLMLIMFLLISFKATQRWLHPLARTSHLSLVQVHSVVCSAWNGSKSMTKWFYFWWSTITCFWTLPIKLQLHLYACFTARMRNETPSFWKNRVDEVHIACYKVTCLSHV